VVVLDRSRRRRGRGRRHRLLLLRRHHLHRSERLARHARSPMMKRLALAALVIAACTDASTEVDPNATAIEVGVGLDTGLGVDQLRISGRAGTMEAFAPGVL